MCGTRRDETYLTIIFKVISKSRILREIEMVQKFGLNCKDFKMLKMKLGLDCKDFKMLKMLYFLKCFMT